MTDEQLAPGHLVIMRVHGTWNCMVWPKESGQEIPCGVGYTPDAAYEDWMRLIAKMEQA